MNPAAASSTPSRRSRRGAWIAGLVGLALVVALNWREPEALLAAYRYAAFAALSPAVGSLIFLLIHRLTGGEWAEGLLPYLRGGVALLPWIWVLTLPLLWMQPARFTGPSDATGVLAAYFSHGAFIVRGFVYALAFFAFAAVVRRERTAPRARPWFGPAGLIVLTFLLHLLATDWFVALEPGWYSTGFGLVWIVAQSISGLAFAVGSAVLAGESPARGGPSGRLAGLDWGNLLLAALVSWTYVAFVEFLIIWSGNLPREISWYLHRGAGGWRFLIIAIAVFQIAVPFFVLLSRRGKQTGAVLGAVAVLLVLGQLAYTAWLLLPAFALGTRGCAAAAIAGLAAGALVWSRYAAPTFTHRKAAP
jgi:hypothetical protein